MSETADIPIVNVPFADSVCLVTNRVAFYPVLESDDVTGAGDEKFFAECIQQVHATAGVTKQVIGRRKTDAKARTENEAMRLWNQ